MSESVPSPQHPEPSTSTVTLTETVDEQDHAVPRLTVKLKKPRTDRKVQWSTETVDNEHLGKKKSKCCCIFNKPRKFGESSSSDSSDDECEHCQGHVEKKKRHMDHQAQKSENSVDPPNGSSPGEPAKGLIE
ncbi:E3 ubiquitin-protein ligase PPP1R11-like [Anthonomus grandis grandis]|uniref:E3 ubiquitin-protein ligase PPP1R11-like n=1 Tax=Anthonomus grandis grandis TaxID=2921223 RepID=UPI00216538E9|nr:E3 ubiquitin-protein ligase PPP1R11-like [Anthonomus grandis grandis]